MEEDTEVNPPGVKGTYKTIEIPPDIATRLNTTRGPILFNCCRVVYNKGTNRLELPKGEVVEIVRRWERGTRKKVIWSVRSHTYIYIYIAREGMKGYRSRESIHLSPMWTEFKSRHRSNMRFSPLLRDVFPPYMYSIFPLSRKPTFPYSNWTRNVDVLNLNRCLLFIDCYIE